MPQDNRQRLVIFPKETRGPQLIETLGYPLLFSYGFILLFFGLVLSKPRQIIPELMKIMLSSSQLLTGHIALTSLGGAFLNAALLTLGLILLAYWQKMPVTGPLVASLFMVSGFAFFGKNIFNSLPMLVGVYLYAKSQKMPFKSFGIVAFFGSSLSPLVSVLAFESPLPVYWGIPLGCLLGIIIGFVLPPLATHFQAFTQGFSLYNVGFTSGILSMLIVGIFRMVGFEIPTHHILTNKYDDFLTLFIFVFSLILFLLGFYFSKKEGRLQLKELYRSSGKIVSDYLAMFGLGSTLINMGAMALLGLAYVKLIGGDLNGPIFGALLSMIGFGAYGSHLFNAVPVFLGVFLTSFLNIYQMNETSLLLAALFSTTLGPISGFYGPVFGIIAGFFHVAMVMNIGYLHGGVNLYNNGFSGGFIAGIMVPILDSLSLKKRRENFWKKVLK